MNNTNKVTKWSVIIGIMIVLNLFFNYALSLAYKSPSYEAFCPTTQVVIQPDNQASCVSQGGQWNGNYYGKPQPVMEAAVPAGYCDLQYTCRQNYDTASKSYNRNVFIVLVLLGAISVFAGTTAIFKGNQVIASGLSLGGVLSFVIASIRYWGDADDLIRVLILAIALGILFWVALKKFRN